MPTIKPSRPKSTVNKITRVQRAIRGVLKRKRMVQGSFDYGRRLTSLRGLKQGELITVVRPHKSREVLVGVYQGKGMFNPRFILEPGTGNLLSMQVTRKEIRDAWSKPIKIDLDKMFVTNIRIETRGGSLTRR